MGDQQHSGASAGGYRYHWGSIIVAPGYTDPLLYASGGNPYGTSLVTGQDIAEQLPAEIETAARYQGRRWAEIAAKLAGDRLDDDGRFSRAETPVS